VLIRNLVSVRTIKDENQIDCPAGLYTQHKRNGVPPRNETKAVDMGKPSWVTPDPLEVEDRPRTAGISASDQYFATPAPFCASHSEGSLNTPQYVSPLALFSCKATGPDSERVCAAAVSDRNPQHGGGNHDGQ